MFRLLLKNSIRHLKRNSLFTFLNILGLTIGISSCWVIFKFVNYELSYEKDIQDKENIYRIVSKLKFEDDEATWSGGVSRPIYFALRDEVSSLDRAVAVFKFYTESVIIPGDGNEPNRIEELSFDNQIVQTEDSYFDMVSYTWLAGNKKGALSSPNNVVLTEERAKLYFPNTHYDQIIGKTLIYSDSLSKVVTGVVSSLDYPSEFNGQEFIQLQKRERDNKITEWTNTSGSDRVYIQAENKVKIESAFAQIKNILTKKTEEYIKEIKPPFKFEKKIELLPLKESHFANYLEEYNLDKTSKTVIYGLIGIAVFLLILACINYINLTTAQIPQRYKEIGIRKTLGGTKGSLILQMMMETAIIIVLALIASIFVSRLGLGLMGELIGQHAREFNNPKVFTLFITGMLVFTLLSAGLYPSWLISKVNAIDTFRNKGTLSIGKNNFNPRKILIVFQFIIAQVFIVAAIIIGQQLQYTIHKDLGFSKDAVLIVDIPYKLRKTENLYVKKKTLAEEIRKIPGVMEMSMGSPPLSPMINSTAFLYKDDKNPTPLNAIVAKKFIDTDYIKFYNLKLLAGENLHASDTTNSFIINETALRTFGFKNPQEAIGKIVGQKGFEFPIVGVMKDFHSRDFYTSIEPVALMMNNYELNSYSIRLNPANEKDWQAIIANIKKEWTQFFPEYNFDYRLFDDAILNFYKKEQQLYKLTNTSTAIAILLSCLGLFGLATITAFQKTKEIGIRKVLGASISGIVGMLSKDFVKMIFIAILIASPIVWWACNKWLEDFVYRIEITGIPFILGGLIAITAALATVSYQALKAAKANPVDSLRDE